MLTAAAPMSNPRRAAHDPAAAKALAGEAAALIKSAI